MRIVRSDLGHSEAIELAEWLSRSGCFERVLSEMLSGAQADMAEEILQNPASDPAKLPPAAIKHFMEADRLKTVLDFLGDVRSGRYQLVSVKVST